MIHVYGIVLKELTSGFEFSGHMHTIYCGKGNVVCTVHTSYRLTLS